MGDVVERENGGDPDCLCLEIDQFIAIDLDLLRSLVVSRRGNRSPEPQRSAMVGYLPSPCRHGCPVRQNHLPRRPLRPATPPWVMPKPWSPSSTASWWRSSTCSTEISRTTILVSTTSSSVTTLNGEHANSSNSSRRSATPSTPNHHRRVVPLFSLQCCMPGLTGDLDTGSNTGAGPAPYPTPGPVLSLIRCLRNGR